MFFIYTNEQIKEILKKYGYILDKFNNVKNIIAHDNNNYFYKITLSNLKNGKTPHWIMRNPFALENFKKYLSINYPDYILLCDEYKGCKEKMPFLCTHHIDKCVQFNTIDNIVNNHHTCKYCSYEKMKNKRMISEDIAIQLCELKNVVYYGRYIKNHETYIQYYCMDHYENGIQEMSLTHFKDSKVPCHYCNISAGELAVKNFLDKNNIEYIYQKTFNDCKNIRVLEFDFFLPFYKAIIEYDGKQHYEVMHFSKNENVNVNNLNASKRRDKIKDEYCIKNNIKMIRIPYWDYENIDTILNKELQCKNTESSETTGHI